MKTQFGTLITGDLAENTLTLEITGDMVLQSGKYAIVPRDVYEKLLKATN